MRLTEIYSIITTNNNFRMFRVIIAQFEFTIVKIGIYDELSSDFS